MIKIITKVSTLIATLLFVGCSQKECTNSPYNGIYNALSCNYEERIDSLHNKLTNSELENLQLFTSYQKLNAKVNNKEEEFFHYKNAFIESEKIITEIEIELNNIDNHQNIKTLLKKIRYQVISMKKKIKTPQPKFTNKHRQRTKR